MEVTPFTLKQRTERHLIKLMPTVVTLIIACLFFPTITSLYERWIKWDESLSHGLVVIGVFLVFIFKSSPWQPIKNTASIQFSSLIFLALASCLWFLFHIVNLYIFEQLMLLPLLFLLITSIFGWVVSARHLVLLAMPIFAIPIWDQLTDPLVNLSGFAVGQMVQLIDIPAIIDGNSIFIPSGHIVIADGCSGLRYFVISLSLGYIISYLNNYNWRKIALVLFVSALLALLANWLRILILVIVGYESNMQSSLMKDHEMFGWLLFAFISFPAIYFSPVVRQKITNSITLGNTSSSTQYSFILPLIAASLGPILNTYIDIKPKAAPLKDLLDYHFQPITAKKMPLKVSSPSAQHTESAHTTSDIYIQVDQYQRIATADKLVPYITRLYNNETWSLIETPATNLGAGRHKFSIFRHKTSGQKVVQLQWFDLSGQQISSIAVAKFLQVPALLQGKNHFMIITLQAKCTTTSCNEAMVKLKQTTQSLTFKYQGN